MKLESEDGAIYGFLSLSKSTDAHEPFGKLICCRLKKQSPYEVSYQWMHKIHQDQSTNAHKDSSELWWLHAEVLSVVPREGAWRRYSCHFQHPLPV